MENVGEILIRHFIKLFKNYQEAVEGNPVKISVQCHKLFLSSSSNIFMIK